MFNEQLQALDGRRLLRRLQTVESAIGPTINLNGRRVILLASNNYLGLSTHPMLIDAAINATQTYGVGSGASRLVSGTLLPHRHLEEALARFKRTEAALTFAAGYLANIGVIPALVGADGLILADRLCHASLIDACRLSRAKLRIFHHGDANHLAELLKRRKAKQPTLVVTDGLFSMDGDIAPLADLAALTERYDALLFVDDAHGTGIMGSTGRGSLEHCDVEARIPFHMGTLSKALGCAGGYLVGSSPFIQWLINTSRSFLYTTAPPPGVAAAAHAALQVIEAEPDRRARLWKNRDYLFAGLRGLGFRTTATVSPIMPLVIGDAERALLLSQHLLESGVYAPAIRPPTVPDSTSRIRVTVTADHTTEQLDDALAAFERAGRAARVI
ncbi:MAG: 8-amino-7-oxononanoate synthase [Nitrospiraceae bacterium]